MKLSNKLSVLIMLYLFDFKLSRYNARYFWMLPFPWIISSSVSSSSVAKSFSSFSDSSSRFKISPFFKRQYFFFDLMLSKIFTEELGTQEDYDRTFQDTPLGKLVRRIVKMDHDATMQLFSEYIDEHKWNSQQIAFVRNLIVYVEEHGYIDDMSILLKPPFDRPMPFVRLYSPEDQKRIISIVNDINENATRLVGQ